VQELKKRGINPDITAGLSLGEYAAVAAAVYGVYRFFTPDYLEDFEDDFEDDYDDDFFEDEEDEEEPAKPAEKKEEE